MVIKVSIVFQEERFTQDGISTLNLLDIEYYLWFILTFDELFHLEMDHTTI